MSRNRIFSSPRMTLATIGAAALAAVSAQPALADEHDDAETAELSEGEQKLAELLEGRVAGEPQNCIRSRLNDRVRTIDGAAYVYGRGRTIYVQRTTRPERIDDRDTLVSRRFTGTEVCRQDIVHTIDPFTGIFTGSVFFTQFVPYTVEEDAG